MNAEKISKLLLPFVNTIFKFFQPKEAERLECLYEVDDPFDDVAIKTVNSDKVITGHFLGKISRVNKLLLDRRATAYAKLTLPKITNNARWSGKSVQNYRKTSWIC